MTAVLGVQLGRNAVAVVGHLDHARVAVDRHRNLAHGMSGMNGMNGISICSICRRSLDAHARDMIHGVDDDLVVYFEQPRHVHHVVARLHAIAVRGQHPCRNRFRIDRADVHVRPRENMLALRHLFKRQHVCHLRAAFVLLHDRHPCHPHLPASTRSLYESGR